MGGWRKRIEGGSSGGGGAIVADTYANWAIKQADNTGGTNGKLPTGTSILITDENVILYCITSNSFDLAGVWLNTVAGVDYYNACEYNFATNKKITVTDFRGNRIPTGPLGTPYFPFNKAGYDNNTAIGEAYISVGGDAGVVMEGNSIASGGKIQAVSMVSGAVISKNFISGEQGLSLNGNAGTFAQNDVFGSGGLTILNFTATIINCFFSFSTGITLAPDITYIGKRYIQNVSSNFDLTIAIVSGVVTFPSNSEHIGIVNVTGLTTDTITSFVNAPTHPFQILPPIDMTSLTISNGTIKCLGGSDIILNGSNKDNAWFIKKSTVIYQDRPAGIY
jgi:hypothetical protein